MGYKLNERIIIERFCGKDRDPETNEIISIWKEHHKCWCYYKALSGKKFAEQNSIHYKRVDSFTIRFCNKTKELLYNDLENYRLKFRDKIYNILYPYDIKNQHAYIDLECEIYE